MTIADLREKCKSRIAKIPRDMLMIVVLVLACSASFGLGLLAGKEEGGQGSGTVLPLSPPAETNSTVLPGAKGQVVASKNGTKYYTPDCAGASRISPAK